MRTLGVIIVGLASLLSGCTTPDVIVTDSAGNPIEGATITGTSLSIGGQKTKTNRKGYASIPWAVQNTRWLSVTKPGYVPMSGIDARQEKPVRIKLQKE